MLLNWKIVESLERPLEVDCTLSNDSVYYRRNIREEIAEEEPELKTKFVYEEVILPEEFRFPILDTEEFKEAIKRKIAEINSQLHITKLDFFNNFCKPAGITFDMLEAKIAELGMKADWNYCNHVYYGVIYPFLTTLPLGKTEEEIIAIFEKLTKD
ncbi:MAG: hypothetical protein IKW45_00520 [Clostridia bacterium]|nr:hypothetical protein [Clostridia bacterium]